jgi:hypothetical protein
MQFEPKLRDRCFAINSFPTIKLSRSKINFVTQILNPAIVMIALF